MKYNEAEKFAREQKLSGKKIVFTNGCFDIIHVGHVTYLEKARSFGDLLILGLNSDLSVKRLKGENRPVNNENARKAVIEALRFVDKVFIFDEDTPYELIKAIKPNFLIKGGDYEVEKIVGADIVNQNGGKVLTIPFVEGYSTSNILKQV
ncbi:MAG: D-glycero-beta-D-manno-heptose 1-phosphate adenylyltransferase [Candidatus Muiribacteriota bacterium]